MKAAGDGFMGDRRRALPLQRPSRARRRPYERLLGDAIDGETLLFAREDGVEASWRVVDNVLTDHEPAHPVPGPHVGPEEQDRLIEDPDELARPDVVDPT